MRKAGILLPIASLPSRFGIGCFSKEAYQFVDQLERSGQKCWQILPLGPTGYGDSPYQSFSTFAGNPYFIDLEYFIREGFLLEEECEACDFGEDKRYIDYEKIYLERFKLLKLAYERSNSKWNEQFLLFKEENKFWLDDYSLYMTIKDINNGCSWLEWEEDLKERYPETLANISIEFEEEIEFYSYLQYIFTVQWIQLKNYANERNIEIIGDIPIYVALDSADCWANKELFQFDENSEPKAVAGCPPDAFARFGQLWGNPLYDWGYHQKTGYHWWINRIQYHLALYDKIRIDHFRGFDAYYSIPYGDETAEFGQWEIGPGYDFFAAIEDRLGKMNVIAEDLGFLTESVKELVEKTGYPGMKVLEFAFGSDERNDYLPHNYIQNCIVYTGTHDNDTIKGWFESISEYEKKFSIEYLNNGEHEIEKIHWDYIRLALSSVAETAVIPMQDYLGLGDEARINIPSTLGDNWTWRLLEDEITDDLLEEIRKLTKLYNR
ncbi:4-alpha-glucanotransferase [Anaerosacchariphilus polymeriproducens]|uniref:4-alpha-glucanotransferase n=1 Tax=Anaerosacchariphilus polymeriproducens TaxID=1812858 RepID=A0A371AQA9_9FIRM|nr:4-alpha-glucanotransferase [Anaerosacchariphilus polymeriproducens]RDU21765.1 4-alpha-glucanotransferase [Anaerosacchariphilus polymeriproducens]